MERYRRSSQRAMLLAVAASFLAVGVLLGVALNKSSQPAQAGNKEINAELSSAFVEISQQVEASVVNISTVTQPSLRGRGLGDAPMPRQSLDSFSYGSGEGVRRGNGSGVIVDAQGYILTNHHVIEGADRIKAKLYDGTELPARVIGSDREVDLAVIKVDAPMSLTPARFGDSEKMRVGDWVLAIGSPFGFEQTVTAGIISARERDSSELYKKVGFQYFLQTDAAINRGNSGGALVNLRGELIGVPSQILSQTGGNIGIGFAIPTKQARNVMDQLLRNGKVRRGKLGVIVGPVTPELADQFGYKGTAGAFVQDVPKGDPADLAGVKPGDIITEFQGQRIQDNSQLRNMASQTTPGASVKFKIWRDGAERELTAKLGEIDLTAANTEAPKNAEPSAASGLLSGVRVENLTPDVTGRVPNATRGVVVVEVEPDSNAAAAGLRRGDVIEEVSRQAISNVDEFKAALQKLGDKKNVLLRVRNQGSARFVVVQAPE